LPDLELAEPRLVDERRDVAVAVDRAARGAAARRVRWTPLFASRRASSAKTRVEARDLLLDQAPLVDAREHFQQQRLGVDRDEVALVVGLDAGLEAERAVRPVNSA
jgi:hypothetical protein